MHSSAKTAISRKTLSAPMRVLSRRKLLCGATLDYGCGRGFDADYLDIQGYDPHWRNDESILFPMYYNTITCNYVLNVIESQDEREKVLDHIFWLLAPKGIAYITVRRDGHELKGKTKSGSWQGYVILDEFVEYENQSFCIYRFQRK